MQTLLFAALGAAVLAGVGVLAGFVAKPAWATRHPRGILALIAGLAVVGGALGAVPAALSDRSGTAGTGTATAVPPPTAIPGNEPMTPAVTTYLPTEAVGPSGGVQYLDAYAQNCGVGGSIQRVGPANINGTNYAHAISQTPNGYRGTAFYLARKASRFQATIGPTDDAPQGQHIRFELATETGSTIFTSDSLGIGQTQQVDVSVDGVLRLFLVATAVGQPNGGIGTAGWGGAAITASGPLDCP